MTVFASSSGRGGWASSSESHLVDTRRLSAWLIIVNDVAEAECQVRKDVDRQHDLEPGGESMTLPRNVKRCRTHWFDDLLRLPWAAVWWLLWHAFDCRTSRVYCRAAIIKRLSLGIVACIGDDRETPTLKRSGSMPVGSDSARSCIRSFQAGGAKPLSRASVRSLRELMDRNPVAGDREPAGRIYGWRGNDWQIFDWGN